MVEQNTWCIARYTSNDAELNDNILYACNALKDCMIIEEGGSCFNPNNLIGHASVVMNQYYAKSGRNPWNCYFSGTGLIVITDPSLCGGDMLEIKSHIAYLIVSVMIAANLLSGANRNNL
ncbi:hypothetical protein Lal_00008319 [Lupinus albus]|nr:hypothetical protein Lal_00008319 [Lupinus albus]